MRLCMSVRVSVHTLAVLALLASIAVAGCGQATSGTISAVTPTANATATTATSSSATARPTKLNPCPNPLDSTTAALGAQPSTATARLGVQAYPSYHLPESSPLKPMDISGMLTEQDLVANPTLRGQGIGGYAFAVCNTSESASDTITGVTAKIATLTPYTGQLNSWNSCSGVYRSGSLQDAGCGGGGEIDDEYLSASFAANAGAGTSVSAMFDGADTSGGVYYAGPLPVTLGPHQSLSFDIGITAPQTPGTYTFAFGVEIGNGAPVYVATSQPMLLAPVAHTWSGGACNSPAMSSQIPANATDNYVCPSS